MWLFTKFGFYSIVQDQQNKAIFKVRARKKSDIEALKKHVLILSECPIHCDKKADYWFRIFINPIQLQQLMLFLANSLDYFNFKESIYLNKTQNDKLEAYHQVWDVMYEYQIQSENE